MTEPGNKPPEKKTKKFTWKIPFLSRLAAGRVELKFIEKLESFGRLWNFNVVPTAECDTEDDEQNHNIPDRLLLTACLTHIRGSDLGGEAFAYYSPTSPLRRYDGLDIRAQLKFTLVDQINGNSLTKSVEHVIRAQPHRSRGKDFSILFDEVHNPSAGFVAEDTVIVKAELSTEPIAPCAATTKINNPLPLSAKTSEIPYGKVFDNVPLPESQGLKNLKVSFRHATKEEVAIHNIRLPKKSRVGDLINELKSKVELSRPNAELRLLEVFYHKIYKVFSPGEEIENLNNQYWTLRAEEILEDEKNIGPRDRLIHVYHFTCDIALKIRNFGEPFFLVIHDSETLADIKVRIQKKLQVPDEDFAKWKFAFISLDRPEYLQDGDVLFGQFERRDVYGAWEQYLGLQHPDTTPKS